MISSRNFGLIFLISLSVVLLVWQLPTFLAYLSDYITLINLGGGLEFADEYFSRALTSLSIVLVSIGFLITAWLVKDLQPIKKE